MGRRFFPFFAAGAVTFLRHRHPLCESYNDENCHVSFESQQHLSNWSSTHLANVRRVYEPKTERELERLLRYYQEKKQKIRPIGTALSPNGISFPDPGSDAVTVHHFNQIQVDPKKLVVKVGAGATVADVLKELSKYGLTLENFSSIQEQQIAGWTQIAAHGTGCLLPTVEEQIIEMKLVTPNAGLLTLSEENLPNGFRFAKVALGSFGVMTEATMRCIPELCLREETTVLDRNTIRHSHYNRLRDYRHVRYMWIPYTSSVVSVVSNPVTNQSPPTVTTQEPIAPSSSEGLPTRALINVIKQSKSNTSPSLKDEFLIQQGFGSLRDIALGVGNPLDLQHVIKVNNAEAEYWKSAQGVRVDDSTKILGFDCGGEQWVMEVCFPIKTLGDETYDDIKFVEDLLGVVESQGIPAHGPIEQRWTARSTAPMSPAYSSNPEDIFCWVGIIMYMPLNQSAEQRDEIRKTFDSYCQALQPLMDRHNAQIHWAKIELPSESKGSAARLDELRQGIRRRYPVSKFQEIRKALDPEGILANSLIERLFDEQGQLEDSPTAPRG